MIWQMTKLFGLDTLGSTQMLLALGGLIALSLALGFYADYVSNNVGFGILANGVVMLAAMLGALVAYAQYVQPLRYATLPMVAGLIVGAAVLALLSTLTFISRPERS